MTKLVVMRFELVDGYALGFAAGDGCVSVCGAHGGGEVACAYISVVSRAMSAGVHLVHHLAHIAQAQRLL